MANNGLAQSDADHEKRWEAHASPLGRPDRQCGAWHQNPRLESSGRPSHRDAGRAVHDDVIRSYLKFVPKSEVWLQVRRAAV